MRSALCAAVAVVALVPFAARSATCSVAEATGRIEVADIQLEARVAKSAIAVMDQQKVLMDSLPKRGDTPVGKLMNGDQAELFGRLNAQTMAFQLEDLIESALARDAEVVEDMYELAHAPYTGAPAPKFSSEVPLQFLDYLKAVAQPKAIVQVSTSWPTSCSVDDALAAEIFDADERLKAFPTAILHASQQATDAIKARYGSLDAPSMTSDDREAVAMARNAVRPAFNEITLESDLQNLRDWWAIAQQVHDDRLAGVWGRPDGPRQHGDGSHPDEDISGADAVQVVGHPQCEDAFAA